MIGIKIIVVLIYVLCGAIVIWAINKVVKIRREDKIESILEAREEVESTLKAGETAGPISKKRRRQLEEAKKNIEDNINLGDSARM